MLFAGWEVCIVKTVTAGRGSKVIYPKPVNNLFIFSYLVKKPTKIVLKK